MLAFPKDNTTSKETLLLEADSSHGQGFNINPRSVNLPHRQARSGRANKMKITPAGTQDPSS